MNDGLTRRDAHILLQRALSEPLGILLWTSEPIAFAKTLYRAKREDPILQSIKILNTPEGVAICHEPHDFQLSNDEDHDEFEES